MKKIIYFDLWTKGIRCFKPIDDDLKLRNVETKLIHFGSFSEPHKKNEIIDGIDVFDISYYNTLFIYNALKIEKPTAVISLNTTFIWDRALVLACKQLNIPCYFAMHGDFFIGDELDNFIKNDTKRNSLLNKIPKLFKYLRYHVLNYLYSYFKASEKPYSYFTVIKVFYHSFINPAKEQYFPKINTDLLYNKAFVYTNPYIEYYNKVGYKKENIIITGYPEYDSVYYKLENNLFSNEDLPKDILELKNKGQEYALYLETSYADWGFYGWNNKYRNEHLSSIAERMKKERVILVIKIHPTNTAIEDLKITSDNYIIIKHADLATLSYFCKFAIIHASTSNNIPFLLNKPLIAPKWGLSKATSNLLPKESISEWNDIDDPIELNIDHDRIDIIQQIIPRINNTNASTIIVNEIIKTS